MQKITESRKLFLMDGQRRKVPELLSLGLQAVLELLQQFWQHRMD